MKLDAMYYKGTVTYTPTGFAPQWQIVADAESAAPDYILYDIPFENADPIEVGRYLTLAMAIKFAVQFK